MKSIKELESSKTTNFRLLNVDSECFRQNEMIPVRYTCDGINISPSLHIEGLPKESVSIAIIVDDPDAPNGNFCHWISWNMPVKQEIKEKDNSGLQGMNDFNRHGYNGPCPGSGTHRYNYKVYALDCTLNIPVSSDKAQLEKAMTDHVLAFGVLTGKYKKQNSSSR